ncbi:MAG: hypothetical protein ACRCYU_11980 [Nocardioides sp.]
MFVQSGAAVLAAKDVDLSGSWKTLYDAVSGPAGPLLSLLAVVGVAIVVIALVKWAWERRRNGFSGGGGRDSGAVWGALFVGVMLSAPTVLLPILLTVMDLIANGAISIWNSSSG